PASSTRQRLGNSAILPNNVNADELLSRDHEFCRRQFHLVDRRKRYWCVAARSPVAVERGHHRWRQIWQFVCADDGARCDTEKLYVKTITLLNFVDGANQLAQIAGNKNLRRRALLECAAIANKYQQLARRQVRRNLNGNSLDKLLAGFRSDIGLNLDILATPNFSPVERD